MTSTNIMQVLLDLAPLLQTLAISVLAYVAKLLRDIRDELHNLDRRLSATEIRLAEQEKVLIARLQDARRDYDHILHRIDNIVK